MSAPLAIRPREVVAPRHESAQKAQVPVVTDTARPRRRRSSGAWLEHATRPAVGAAVVILSIVLMVGSLMFRVFAARSNARLGTAEDGVVSAAGSTVDPSAEVLSEAKAQAEAAGDRLVRDRDEFTGLLAQIEEDAQKRGWRIDLSFLPSVPSPAGLRELTLHRAVALLTPTTDAARTSFPRLLEWLEGVSKHPRQVEVAGLNVEGDTGGVVRLRVELHSLGRITDEETAPK